MKISTRKRTALVAIMLCLVITGILSLSAGKTSYGIGIIGGALVIGVISWRNINQIARMEEQGVNPYDERVMQIAGLAAQGAIKLSMLGLALFVGFGSVIGPVIKVNPYDFAGYLLFIICFLYIGFYAYHKRRL